MAKIGPFKVIQAGLFSSLRLSVQQIVRNHFSNFDEMSELQKVAHKFTLRIISFVFFSLMYTIWSNRVKLKG